MTDFVMISFLNTERPVDYHRASVTDTGAVLFSGPHLIINFGKDKVLLLSATQTNTSFF